MPANTATANTATISKTAESGTGPTAAETVATALAGHPDGITTRALAKATGLAQTTVQTALLALEHAGTAHRTPGERTGAADQWHPTTDTTTPADTAADVTTNEATPDEANPDEANPDGAGPDEARSADEPGAPPRRPDLKVMIMARVLGGHPDGVPAVEAVEESGLASGVGDAVLAAMEAVGAATRGPADEHGVELWVLGGADITDVDLAAGPSPQEAVCPTCRAPRPVRRHLAPAGRRARTAAPTSGAGTGTRVNGDGTERLRKNGLRAQVEAFMRSLGTGVEITPGVVGRELGGRSSGAVGNAMAYLTGPGVLVLTRETPVTYALSTSAPAPTLEIAELMARPVLPATDTATTADSDGTAPDDDAPEVTAAA
jgi:hypothetical protein